MRKKQGVDCDKMIKIIIHSLASSRAATCWQKFAQRREREKKAERKIIIMHRTGTPLKPTHINNCEYKNTIKGD